MRPNFHGNGIALLPADTSTKNFLGLPSNFPYGVNGVPHFMSIAQGTGWGFRHEC